MPVTGVHASEAVTAPLPRPPQAQLLLERDSELRTIDTLLTATREGHGGTLVVEGEPGIGKTAMLDIAARSAGDLALTRVSGVEPETQLSFAGLHRLLIPLLGRLERLPLPQRLALQSAFGLAKADPPDRFLVSLAVLTLLDDAATTRPLLVIVDDAQWLDRESRETLAFVSRRLHADRVAMLFATADPLDATQGLDMLPGLKLAGLSAEAAGALLRAVTGNPVEDGVAHRIAGDTRGNPLAIAELAGELSPAQLLGRCQLPELLPVGRRLEERVLRHVRELPDEVQTLLLIAAASGPLDHALLHGAAAQVGIDLDVAIECGATAYLIVDSEVQFCHPLQRSAIYNGATSLERRRVHEALAAVSGAAGDRERQAWHRAAGAVGPDESIAADLQFSAERTRERGGYAATAALLGRAAELTPDSSRRAERLLETSQAELAAGDPAGAQVKLDEAIGQLADARQRAAARRTQGAIEFACGHSGNASSTLLAAAAQFAQFNQRLARATFLEALEAGLLAGRLARGCGLSEVAAAAAEMPLSPGRDRGFEELLLNAFATRATTGYARSVPLMQETVRRLREGELPSEHGLRVLGLGCYAAGDLFDLESYGALALRWAELAREACALNSLPRALAAVAYAELQAGRFRQADDTLAERRDVALATDNPTVLGATAPVGLLLSAWRGEAETTRTGADSLIRAATELSQGIVVDFAQSALVVLELGFSEYEPALAAARSVCEGDSPHIGTRVLPDLIEAAVRCEEQELARATMAHLAERALASGGELGLALLARSRALLDDNGAEDLYGEALERLGRTLAVPEVARTHLLSGEWLRRQRRRRDARKHLRHAYGLFESLGATGFAERAAAELLATGGHARKRDETTRDELTAQEGRIARLAAQGASNSEIAEKLFISASTVAYHLRKVFRKLDVNSRGRLASALARDGLDQGDDAAAEFEVTPAQQSAA